MPTSTQVLPVVINAIVQNAGQTCSAGSRLLVEQGHLRTAARTPG
jgi:aldehyde dehydrogenase (NAD+)